MSKLNDIANFSQYLMNKKAYDKKTDTYGAAEVSDINYMGDNDPNHVLDVYSPAMTNKKLPVIVEVHGGGYISNKKVCNRPHGQWLAAHGSFKVVNVEYTLIPEATVAQELQEITAAIAWVEDHADEYGFDTKNIFLTGDSSGGHLVLLMAAVQNRTDMQEALGVKPVKSGIRAMAATCPVGSFIAHDFVSTAFRIIGRMHLHLKRDNDVKMLSYENLITEAFPECMLVTTPSDVGIHTTTKNIHKAMKKNHVPHEYVNIKKRSNPLKHVFNVLELDWDESIEANNEIMSFFRSKMI